MWQQQINSLMGVKALCPETIHIPVPKEVYQRSSLEAWAIRHEEIDRKVYFAVKKMAGNKTASQKEIANKVKIGKEAVRQSLIRLSKQEKVERIPAVKQGGGLVYAWKPL